MNLKTRIDGLVTTFIKNLDTKYGTGIATKIVVLDTLINKVTAATRGKSTALFTYFKEQLEAQSDILRLQNLLTK